MKSNISKLCADTLRTLAVEKYDAKLKAAHAHELVAAYFGYRSRNSLLAEERYPVDDLGEAEIIVMMPDGFVSERREKLQELSSALPNNSVLVDAIHRVLVENNWLQGPFPPFKDFDVFAKTLISRSTQYDAAFPFDNDVPLDHFVHIESSDDQVLLTVAHAYKPENEESLAEGYTKIRLPRVAGRIGYAAPTHMPTRLSGGMRRTLKSLGVRP